MCFRIDIYWDIHKRPYYNDITTEYSDIDIRDTGFRCPITYNQYTYVDFGLSRKHFVDIHKCEWLAGWVSCD